ncbi:MAG: hypothetical protein KDB07_13480, partial [Planctomycetes bacterium]|nr:hypothetical protein [Planctomycetota bacterium]
KSASKRGKTLFQAFEKQYLKSAKRNYGEDVYGVLEMRVKFACGQITNPREAKSYTQIKIPEETSLNLHEAAQAFVTALRTGEAHELMARVAVMDVYSLDFSNWDNVSAVNSLNKRAADKAEKGAKDIIEALADDDGMISRMVKARSDELGYWAKTVPDQWRDIWSLYAQLRAHPLDVRTTYTFAQMLVSSDAGPLNIVGLVLLEDLTNTFPEDRLVSDGYVAVALADAYVKAYNFDAAERAIAAASKTATDARKRALDLKTRSISDFKREFEQSFKPAK